MRTAVLMVAALAGAALTASCDVCAGTPSCHNPPEVSVGGQFIERKSGATLAGVAVEFVRRRGALTDVDTVRAVSDREGFFQLRMGALQDGNVVGDLRVTPPAPYKPYVATNVTLPTSRTRGDGSYLGRLVVNPYLVFVGDVYDRTTRAPVAGATVTLRRISGARLYTDEMTFTSGSDGRLAWIDPDVVEFGVLRAEFEISAPGYPRAFRFQRDIPLSFKDGEIAIMGLPMGSGLTYLARTTRRGTGEALPGVSIEFRRTSGIAVQPDPLTLTPNADGYFVINLAPQGAGTVTGNLTITPPAPYPVETRTLTLAASDDDITPTLGDFGYGAMEFLSAYFRYRGTGLPVNGGIVGEVKRVSGLRTLASPEDNGWRALADDGRLVYSAATTDTGTTIYQIVARLAPPFVPETLKAVAIPSRYSDLPTELGVIRVGSWYPWQGIVLDAANDQPVSGASVSFRRTSGATIPNDLFTALSGTDGTFPLQPVPQERGVVTGNLTISAPGYASTAVNGVQLRTTEDDTLRTIGTYRLARP